MKKSMFDFLLVIAIFAVAIPLEAQWVHVGLGNRFVRTLAISANGLSGNTLFAGTSNGGLFISTNNGENWFPNDLMNNDVSAILVSGRRIIVGTMGTGIFISTNNGTSWAQSSGASNAFVYCMVRVPNDLGNTDLFASTNLDIYHSTDNGFSWFPLNTTFSGYHTALATAPRTGGGTNLFAGDGYFNIGDGHIYLSTDTGLSWSMVSGSINTEMINSISMHQDGVGSINIFAGTEGAGIFRSTDQGTSWTEVNNGLGTGVNLYIYCFASSNTSLFAGTFGGGVFLSTNNGADWLAVNEGLTNKNIISLMVSESYLFAGSYDGGVWRRPLSEMVTSVESDPENFPAQFILEQNYPNPLNPSTKISWQSPVSSWQTLKIFDVLGNEVATLVDEYKPAGSYEVEFDASNLPSGTYFYKLQAGSYTETKKMILMK